MRNLWYPLGILVAIGSMIASMLYLKQPLSSYYDFVAAAMVFGGTMAVGLMTLPWEHARDMGLGLRDLILPVRRDSRETLRVSLKLIAEPLRGQEVAAPLHGVARMVIQEGSELIALGFNSERIEPILRERVFQAGKRLRRVANSVRSLAKYPPAFGLMGTVIGLVNLMRAISTGLDAKQTGVEMAVALVATFYGLIVANLVINPSGECILRRANQEEEEGEIALRAVLLAADRVSLLEAQEMLNSYVAPELRVNVIQSQSFRERELEQEAS
jgi:chemotaxis protein MotA